MKVAHWAAPKAAYLAGCSVERWVVAMVVSKAAQRVDTSAGCWVALMVALSVVH